MSAKAVVVPVPGSGLRHRTPRPGTYRAALTHLEFRRLMTAYGVTAVGQTFGTVAMAVAMFDRTGSAGWVGAIAAARLLPYVLVPGLAGVVAAHVPRRRLLVGSAAVRAVLVLVMALGVKAGVAPIILVVLAFVFTAFGTPCYPAIAAAVPETLSAEDLAPGNGLLTGIETFSFIAGPALGGAVLVRGTPATALVVNALVFVLAVALAARLAPAPPITNEHEPMRSAALAGLRAIRSAPGLVAPVVLVVAVNLVYGGALVALVLYSDRVLDGGDAGFGLLNAGLGVGALIGVATTNSLARVRRQLVVLGAVTLLAGVPVALLAGVSSLAVATLLMVPAGAGCVATEVLAMTLVQRVVTRERVAHVFGMLDSLIFSALFLGSVIAPALIRLVGVRASLAVIGAVLPAVALLTAAHFSRSARRHAGDPTVARVVLFQRLPWLRDALLPTLEALAADAEEETVEAGTSVIEQGADPDDFFVLESGTLEVRKRRHADAKDEVVAVLTPGAGFGEIGLLQRVPRTASVVARERSIILRVRGDRFVGSVSAVTAAAGGTLGGGLLGRLGGGAGEQ